MINREFAARIRFGDSAIAAAKAIEQTYCLMFRMCHASLFTRSKQSPRLRIKLRFQCGNLRVLLCSAPYKPLALRFQGRGSRF